MTERPGTPPSDPGELADQREREADEMERRNQALASEVSDARDDWARKRSDEGVPGAPAPEDEPDPGSDADHD